MTCPSCGAENQTGKFCAECGAGLQLRCPSCDAAVPPGASFCTECGEPVTAGRRSRAGWIIGGAAAAIVILLVLFLPRQADRVEAPRTGSAVTAPTAGPGGGSGMAPLSDDMRTNADRLFNRIMVAAEQGDRAEVDQFMPMAIQAYEMVDDLDDDGLYHLATLHLTAGDPAEARRVAQRILDDAPSHILALGAAALAEEQRGDAESAVSLWRRLLDAYPEESGQPRPEYLDHQGMLTEYRGMAREATSS